MPSNAVHSSTPCCVCGRCAYAVARAGTHPPGQAPAKPASGFKQKAVKIAALQYSLRCIRVTCIHGYIAGIAQAPKQMVMHPCIRRNAQHVRQSTCFMPSIACLMSSALSLLLCHASCMVNTQGGVLRRMCCTAFGTLHPPAEHRKLHVDDQDERKFVHSQTETDRHQGHGSLWYLHVCKKHSTIQACDGHSTAIGGAMVPLSVSQDFWLWPSMSLRASPRG